MFTGIIEEIGNVTGFGRRGGGAVMTVQARRVTGGLSGGASVSVDGVCLTVVSPAQTRFSAEISPETLRRSTLGRFRAGRQVNLERPVSAGGFMGGHLVQGHVDGTAEVLSLQRSGDHADLEVDVPKEHLAYLVPKGSVALNGVSLTVAEIRDQRIRIALIPTTLKGTNLGACRKGDLLNIELDIIGKYVRSFVEHYTR